MQRNNHATRWHQAFSRFDDTPAHLLALLAVIVGKK